MRFWCVQLPSRDAKSMLNVATFLKTAVRLFSLTKLMVSHPDLLYTTVTKQVAFDQRDLPSAPVFEHAIDHRCQALVSKLKTLDPSLLSNCTANQEYYLPNWLLN